MNLWLMWGLGIAAGICGLLLLVLWSVRRHRAPTLRMACEGDMHARMVSLAGLSLGAVVPGILLTALQAAGCDQRHPRTEPCHPAPT